MKDVKIYIYGLPIQTLKDNEWSKNRQRHCPDHGSAAPAKSQDKRRDSDAKWRSMSWHDHIRPVPYIFHVLEDESLVPG